MGTSPATVLLREEAESTRVARTVEPSANAAWKAIGWFGLLLAVVGLVDAGLHWFPAAFGSPEWEFGTVAISAGALPLPTIGLAALLGSFLARGVSWGVRTTAIALLLLGLVVLAAYLLFLTDVPLALKAATGPAARAVDKAIIRTTVMGPGFGIAYITAGIISLRHLARKVEHE